MIKKARNLAISTGVTSLLLFGLGFIISYYFTSSLQTLGFILFVIGAIPIVLFSSGLFSSSSSGALHTPKVFYRLVGTLKREKNTPQGEQDGKEHFFSTLSLVLSGVILWVISYFV